LPHYGMIIHQQDADRHICSRLSSIIIDHRQNQPSDGRALAGVLNSASTAEKALFKGYVLTEEV
jgi:hypothetical protein